MAENEFDRKKFDSVGFDTTKQMMIATIVSVLVTLVMTGII